MQSPLARFPRFRRIGDSFSLDLRSLALFRIGLASLVLIDLISRSRDLNDFYTDSGVLPREAVVKILDKSLYWSIHLMSGAMAIQIALFALAAFFAVLLLIGSHTRFVTVASWLLLLSLHNRNGMVLNGGDFILRHLLFWGMFLPLGACFSVDSSLHSSQGSKPPHLFLSMATVALTLQICAIYFFSVFYKTDAPWIIDHTAIYYALSMENLATPLGRWLTQFPDVLKIFTVGVLKFEFYGPILVLLFSARSFARTFLVLSFIGFHLGLGLCLQLGLFGLISAVMWLAILPSEFWHRLSQFRWIRLSYTVIIYYDQNCSFCCRMTSLVGTLLGIPVEWFRPAQSNPAVYSDLQKRNSWVIVDQDNSQQYGFDAFLVLLGARPALRTFQFGLRIGPLRWLGNRIYRLVADHRPIADRILSGLQGIDFPVRLSWFGEILVAFFLVYVLLWNIRSLYAPVSLIFPPNLNFIANVTRCDQGWNMFAPAPRKDGWFVMPAQLRNGTQVDLFRPDKPLSWDKPTLILADYRNNHWKAFLLNWKIKSRRKFRFHYATYLYNRWNASHPPDGQIIGFQIYYFQETNLLGGSNSKPIKSLLWNKPVAKKYASHQIKRGD